jgi:hypothetical protein
VYTVGRGCSVPAVPVDAVVETVAFRKPKPAAVLKAACPLAALAGPQLVFDESATAAFVVQPGDLEELALVSTLGDGLMRFVQSSRSRAVWRNASRRSVSTAAVRSRLAWSWMTGANTAMSPGWLSAATASQ